jgi:hypothetical protein
MVYPVTCKNLKIESTDEATERKSILEGVSPTPPLTQRDGQGCVEAEVHGRVEEDSQKEKGKGDHPPPSVARVDRPPSLRLFYFGGGGETAHDLTHRALGPVVEVAL